MKTTLKIFTSLFIIFSLVSIHTSCEGEDGRNGEIGPQGTDGQDGNANVMTSNWFTPDSDAYELTVTSQAFFFLEVDITAPEVTQEILDNGVVLVYARLNAYSDTIWPDDQVGLMPITIMSGANSTTQIDTWAAKISVGNIKIHITNQEQDYTFQIDDLDPSSFRYVIIPSVDTTGKSAIDFSNYEIVKKLYALED
ncbi:hypothetical protein [uncultured Aquimarina sp.]|uniref:hypothetical protein n=1 Tax=uncultured Aquimarina sp. TaxID=575652 RepID=UPI002630FB4A|nr:hypothetical protein [uncultured Aquimarina sp.]